MTILEAFEILDACDWSGVDDFSAKERDAITFLGASVLLGALSADDEKRFRDYAHRRGN